MDDQYTPSTDEVRSGSSRYIGTGAFDRWLAAHDAEVRVGVIQDIRRLADARDDYSHPEVRRETDAVRLVADILEGKNEGWGWLPSWRWHEFGVPDPTTNHTGRSTT